jgi:hypothetical protein
MRKRALPAFFPGIRPSSVAKPSAAAGDRRRPDGSGHSCPSARGMPAPRPMRRQCCRAAWTGLSTRSNFWRRFSSASWPQMFSSRWCCAGSTHRFQIATISANSCAAFLIFWGIAVTSYRGTHITVDVVWANVAPSWQRVFDVFATLVLLFVVSVQTYTLFDKTSAPTTPIWKRLSCGYRCGRSSPWHGSATSPPSC